MNGKITKDKITLIRATELTGRKSGNRKKPGKSKRRVIKLSDGKRIIGKMKIKSSLPAHRHEEIAREAAYLMHQGLVYDCMEQWVKKKMETTAKPDREFPEKLLQDNIPDHLSKDGLDYPIINPFDLWSNTNKVISSDYRWSREPGKFRVLVIEVNHEADRVTYRDIDSNNDLFTKSCGQFVEFFDFVQSYYPVRGAFWRKILSHHPSDRPHDNVVVIEEFNGKEVIYGNPDGSRTGQSDDANFFFTQYVPVEYPVPGERWQNIKHFYYVTITRVGKSSVWCSSDEEHFIYKIKLSDFRKHFNRIDREF